MRRLRILAMAVAMMVIADSANAQFILGVQGSYLTGAGGDKKGQFGIGAQGKVKLSNAVAVGGTVRSWLKNYQDYTVSGGGTARSADATTQLAGMLEIYFGKRVQPYIGTDAGLYFTNTVIQSGSNVDVSDKKTHFGIAPKAGIQFNTGFISPFIQAQYHLLFGGGDEIVIPGTGGNAWNIESQKKFTTLDFGILFQIGRVGGKGNKKNDD